MHVHLWVCGCVCICVRCLLPTHVSNTKPSNCPHGPGENDQQRGRDRWMDGKGELEYRIKGSGRNEGSETCSLSGWRVRTVEAEKKEELKKKKKTKTKKPRNGRITSTDGSETERQEHGQFRWGNSERGIMKDTLADFVLNQSAAVFSDGPKYTHTYRGWLLVIQ